jgi:hypothetical protein
MALTCGKNIYFLTFMGKIAKPDLQYLFRKKKKKNPACQP